LVGALSRLYADDVPRRDTGRARASAEAERNSPATTLSRSDLGWRSLLFARPELPSLGAEPLPSVVARGPGNRCPSTRCRSLSMRARLRELRRRSRTSGSTQPHTVSRHDAMARRLRDRVLCRPVAPLVPEHARHNAPLVDGRSQPRASGDLIAFEDRGPRGWLSASAPIGRRAMRPGRASTNREPDASMSARQPGSRHRDDRPGRNRTPPIGADADNHPAAPRSSNADQIARRARLRPTVDERRVVASVLRLPMERRVDIGPGPVVVEPSARASRQYEVSRSGCP